MGLPTTQLPSLLNRIPRRSEPCADRRTRGPDRLPRLSLHAKATGPFAVGEGIKHRYIGSAAVTAPAVAAR